MKQLNDENIDELMFMLLEGEIVGEDRNALLDAIHADPEYSKIWAAWQNTIITPTHIEPTFDVQKLKRNSGRVFSLPVRKFAIAAAIVLAGFLAFYIMNKSNTRQPEIAGNIHGKPSKPVIQVPQPADKVSKNPLLPNQDTVLSKTEYIRSMASKHTENRSSEKKPMLQDTASAVRSIENKPVMDHLADHTQQTINKEKQPDSSNPNSTIHQDNIIVSVHTSKTSNNVVSRENESGSWIKRLFLNSKIKLENDSNTRTNRKIIIENNKYQIIAGF